MITGAVCELKSCCNQGQASNSPDSSHSIPSTAVPSFPPKITQCNLHAPSRCSGWWMPTIHTRPLQMLHNSTFITRDNHYVQFDKISSHTDPVELVGFGFYASAEKRGVLLRFYTLLFISKVLLYTFNVACLPLQEYGSWEEPQTCQVYGCTGRCVKP